MATFCCSDVFPTLTHTFCSVRAPVILTYNRILNRPASFLSFLQGKMPFHNACWYAACRIQGSGPSQSCWSEKSRNGPAIDRLRTEEHWNWLHVSRREAVPWAPMGAPVAKFLNAPPPGGATLNAPRAPLQ